MTNKTVFRSLLASLSPFRGFGQSAPTPKEPTLIEEAAINVFDPEGEHRLS